MTRIAILGCGKIARTMAATLRGMRDGGEAVCLYAAASRRLETAQAFAAQEGFAPSQIVPERIATALTSVCAIA